MTQEQKEILIKDLCARLPYGVKCEVVKYRIDGEILFIRNGSSALDLTVDNVKELVTNNMYEIKPYLFPLSSMTEEQKQELNSLLPVGVSLQINSNNFTYFEIDTDIVCCFHIEFWDKFFDWLNKNHFDHRGLIEKGLALDATNKNIYD
jgi:hypothetical protein